MTKNITLRMNEKDLKQLKHIAVEHDMSVSAWITKAALEAAEKEGLYEQRKQAAWRVMDTPLHLGGETFDRESCYDRLS
jgi:hypothetical protein